MKSILLSLFLLISNLTNISIVDDIVHHAEEQNKNIAIYFAGSDWCTNCHQFRKAVLEEAAVKDIIDNAYVFYTADFPQRKKLAKDVSAANDFLADKLNPNGEFPLLVIVDKNWNIKARIYKNNNNEAVIKLLQKNVLDADS